MNPGLVVKLRPNGPWRIGPDSGARNRVDVIYHSDSLYSAVTAAMSRLGWLEEWLDATARTPASAVSFGSCYPFMDDINFVVPPRTVWPPSSNSAKAPRVRWRSARFVPLKVVQSILSGKRVDENQWTVDGPSDCLVPNGKPGPFRTAVRFSAGVDRLTGTAERHSTGCIEFRPGAGLWTVVSFRDEVSQTEWSDKVKAAFRLLADSGFGGERSRGWGRSEEPLFVEGMLPDLILPMERIRAAAVRERRQAAQLKVEVAAEIPVVSAPVAEAPAGEEAVVETPVEGSPAPPEAEAPVAEAVPVVDEPVVETPAEAVPTAMEQFPAPATAELAAEVPGFAHAHEGPAPVAEPPDQIAAAPANEDAGAATLTEPAAGEPVESTEAPAVAVEAGEIPPPDGDGSEAVVPVAEPPVSEATRGESSEETVEPTELPEVAVEATEIAPPHDQSSEAEVVVPAAEPPVPEATLSESSEDSAASTEVAEATPASAPEPVSATHHPHWLLSVFTPAPTDSVDWARGNYTVLARGGRIDSPVRSGELKKQIQMVGEGSVLYAESSPSGSAADVAPDGFAHPVFRAGFAVAIPLPEVS